MDLRVSFVGLSGYRVFTACLGLASAFVLSLYAVSAGLPRNHPVTVRRRILATVSVCLAAPVYVWVWSSSEGEGELLWRVLGVKQEGLLWAVVCPVALILLAYLGPLVHYVSVGENPLGSVAHDRADINLRNYVVAPFSEEFVFRACLMPFLLPALGPPQTVLLCPLFFGVAHLHHILEWLYDRATPISDVLIGLALQVGYTSVFGMFSAFLFVRTGHLVSPVLAHSLCNLLGLPPVDELTSHPHPIALLSLYLLGMTAFILLLFPLTDPTWFS
jgi:prenyl protein peptidase